MSNLNKLSSIIQGDYVEAKAMKSATIEEIAEYVKHMRHQMNRINQLCTNLEEEQKTNAKLVTENNTLKFKISSMELTKKEAAEKYNKLYVQHQQLKYKFENLTKEELIHMINKLNNRITTSQKKINRFTKTL